MVKKQTMPELIILTGSPGSGKSTLAGEKYPNHHLCYKDLGTQDDYKKLKQDCVLTVCSPTRKQKAYWLAQARSYGFTSKLLVVWVERWTAYDRMSARSGTSKDQMNNKQKGVQTWFRLYQPHKLEEKVENVRREET